MGWCKRICWRRRTCAEHVKWGKVNQEVDLRLHVLKSCQVGWWTFQTVINILHTFWALSLLLQCKFPGRGGAGAALPCTAGSWLMWDLTSPFLIFQPARFSMTLISSLAISSLTISVFHLNWSVPRFSGVLMSFSVWWSARGLVKHQGHPAYCILFIHPLCYSWQKEAELFIFKFLMKNLSYSNFLCSGCPQRQIQIYYSPAISKPFKLAKSKWCFTPLCWYSQSCY